MSEHPDVHCYSGHTYADRPSSFDWQGERHVIARIESTTRTLDRDSGVVGMLFSVLTTSGRRFRLTYEAAKDRWTIAVENEA